jgi:hypothetical protein
MAFRGEPGARFTDAAPLAMRTIGSIGARNANSGLHGKAPF